MEISFKLGLRAQEIALLQIKEVAKLTKAGTAFQILEIMSLPAAYTKGADAMGRSKTHYHRKMISFDVESFNKVVQQIELLVKSGVDIDPEIFYPPVKKHRGKSRDLPMVDPALRISLSEYLSFRLSKDKKLSPSSPLFVTQKGVPYSPNTLQEHMALMLLDWDHGLLGRDTLVNHDEGNAFPKSRRQAIVFGFFVLTHRFISPIGLHRQAARRWS